MTCCGGRRGAVQAAAAQGSGPATVLFERREPGALTVYGRVTGTRYHFPGVGARVAVDARDAPVLDVIRGLENVERQR